jgi:hypothetical protein
MLVDMIVCKIHVVSVSATRDVPELALSACLHLCRGKAYNAFHTQYKLTIYHLTVRIVCII